MIAMPDGEAQWRDYAAAGWTIRTLAERIILQPLVKRYETPTPVLKAIALGIPIIAIGSTAGMYYGINPISVAIAECAAIGILFFWASGQLEMTEIEDSPTDESELVNEDEPIMRAEEITSPGRNSLSIKVLYEPPEGATPESTRRLAHATLSLARLATNADNPLERVSFDGAKTRGWKAGNPTFETIQGHWISRGLAMMTDRNWCYLTNRGKRILGLFVAQSHSPTE